MAGHAHHKAQAHTMLKKGIITQKAHDRMVAKIDAMAPPEPASGQMGGDPMQVGETVAPPAGAAAAGQNDAPPASTAAPSTLGPDQRRLVGASA